MVLIILIIGSVSGKKILFLKPKAENIKNLEKNILKNANSSHSPSGNQEKSQDNLICDKIRKAYSHLNSLIKNQSNDLRFENIHKKIGSNIYRLRHFFKDGDEGERETFLVYLEDFEENAKIVEKSTYQKGRLFLKVEKSEGEIIYHEEGINHGNNLFLHYINNQLREAQGQSDENVEFVGLDCHFQHA